MIELLVVVAIIAVTAALLVPVFTSAIRKGHEARCTSNIRQIAMGILLYAEDNDHLLPRSSIVSGMCWYEAIQPEVNSVDILACPDDPVESSLSLWSLSDGPPPRQASYGFNLLLGGLEGHNVPVVRNHPLQMAKVIRPASTVMPTDIGTTAEKETAPDQWRVKQSAITGGGRTLLADATFSGVTGEKSEGPCAPHARHHNMAVVSFVDGHVRALPSDAFYTRRGRTAQGESEPGLSPCLQPDRGCPQ